MSDLLMLEFISIEEDSKIPKYLQIVDSVIHNISIGNITAGDKIPSINALSVEYYLSRDTVARAYNILKERKIITSIQGKGNYIAKTKLISKLNVLFFVNKLSNYKLKIFNSFRESLGPDSHADLQVYHCDESLFIELIKKYKSAYDYYVIMPHFKSENLGHVSITEKVKKVIDTIPKEKLVILDNDKHEIKGDVSEVYQDFENDIYNALQTGYDKVSQYERITLVYPGKSLYPYPKRILHGFRKFCVHYDLNYEIINEVDENRELKKGDLYITIQEDDLVNLMNNVRSNNFVLGEDMGIISYNDTPLKALLGITVISTDFQIMGEMTANMILNNEHTKRKTPFNFIDRKSA